MAALSWAKQKSKESARKLVEAVQTHNNLSVKYNELEVASDETKRENARLKKKLEEADAELFAQEIELKEAKSKAEHFEDKSTSMKLFTTVKVRTEMLKEYKEGQFSTWDPEAAFSAWEQMKLLYYDSKGEEEQQVDEPAGSSRVNPSGLKNVVPGSGVAEEEVTVEEIAE